uniref:Dual specificity protein kinase TTK n=1 Tax=Pyxicephalus adspersus TaxID=30357 RepID=A0AAV3AGR0_PYXAD|nr:TPA: hypothetical protein GDO54_010705 [Pyxicephalus adspersus]
MDDEDISERKLKIASILDRVKKLKKTEDTLMYGSEDNWTGELILTKSSADTTEHSGFFNSLLTPKTSEEWLTSLLKLENTGLPQMDQVLLNRLLENYSHAVRSLPSEKHSHNESYAKILVRFGELKTILDPDEARDQFQVASLSSKKFAFVHVAFAQFEISQGNFKKAKQILQRGKDCGAVPAEMIELALKNLQLRKTQLISDEDKENLSLSLGQYNGENGPSCAIGKPNKTRSDSSGELSVNMRFLFGEKISSPEDCDEMPRKPLTSVPNKTCQFGRVRVQTVTSPDDGASDRDVFPTSSVKRQPSGPMQLPVFPSLSKPKCVEDEDLKPLGNKSYSITSPTNQQQLNENSVEMETASSVIIRTDTSITGKRMSIDPSAFPAARRVPPPVIDTVLACRTPAKPQEDYMSCFRTPVVKEPLRPLSMFSTPCDKMPSYKLPHTPANPILQPSAFPMTPSFASNDCIVVKGRIYIVLKQIGTGGSSKVFQVMDEKKHLYAIKYVDLEEADRQTIESYQNEISHLNKLQQHSDKIIRLYDYEITKQHIYMVMECGNIDLNTWLRKKKTINPWERKSYWKNMLEAVHTIHQHGIVHSDLKPANFLIVDGMLKLIDFGIANQIQPDVTSIVKDSQVGTINYMPPEAIKDNTSFGENGRPRSKISPKGDVWSLGCILYCMTYGKTPFQHITNQITKLHAILDPSYEIEIPDIPEKDLQDVLKKCLVRNPKERISIAELLVHPYVQIQPQPRTDQLRNDATEEMKRVLGQLIELNSPNSISRAAKSLYAQYSRGKNLDLSTASKQTSQNTWTTK